MNPFIKPIINCGSFIVLPSKKKTIVFKELKAYQIKNFLSTILYSRNNI